MIDDGNIDSDTLEREIWRVCTVLESIAANYAPDSAEAEAIKDAAIAFTLVAQQGFLKQQYRKLRSTLGGELSEEIDLKLRQHGIDPDAFEQNDAEGS